MKKNEQSLREMQDTVKITNIHKIEVAERKKEKGTKKSLEKQ